MRATPAESARTLAGSTGGKQTLPQDITLLIDAVESATLLSIGSRTLWSLTNRKAIPSHRIGRSVRYCPRELEAWIDCGCPTDPGAADRVRAATKRLGRS